MLGKHHFLIVLLLAIYFSFFTSTGAEYENSKYLYFPNKAEVEDCEKNNSKCEHFSTYPRLFIEDLIKKNFIKKEWFSGDNNSLTHLNVLNDDEEYKSRLCLEHKLFVRPKGKMTKNGEFVYIVQTQVNKDYYYQVVEVNICKDVGGRNFCSVRDNKNSSPQFLKSRNEKYNFTCEQERSTVSMVGVTLTGKVVRNVQFEFDCCCVCKYRNFSSEFN